MSGLGFIVRLLMVCVALWSGGFLAFAYRVSTSATQPAAADGITVLTGSAGRILAGIDLLKQRPQTRMLITGVGDGTAREELADAFPEDATLFDCCIELDRHAKDTVGNAKQTALWVQRNNLTSLVVVTAASHMPRSLVEMRRQMKNIRIEPLPTRAGDDDPVRWWLDWKTVKRFTLEYNKYIFSLFRARLFDDIGDVRAS